MNTSYAVPKPPVRRKVWCDVLALPIGKANTEKLLSSTLKVCARGLEFTTRGPGFRAEWEERMEEGCIATRWYCLCARRGVRIT